MLLPLLFAVTLEDVLSAIRQGKEIRSTPLRKNKLSLFGDDRIVHRENLKEFTKTFWNF